MGGICGGSKIDIPSCGNGTGAPGNIIYKGIINEPADFPDPSVVQIGWEYRIGYKETINVLTSAGGVATADASSVFYNNFVNGASIIIEKADQNEYNGTFVGTKGAPNLITYPISGTPTSPATGNPTIASPPVIVDNDPTKTNTGQTFPNNREIRWNGQGWDEVGPDGIFISDGKTIKQVNPALDQDVGNVLRGTINDIDNVPAGFVDKDNVVLSINDGTRTFTAAIDGGETDYEFYSRGKKFKKTTDQDQTFTDLEGLFTAKFGFTGTLSVGPVSSLSSIYQFRETEATCSLFYWDATNKRVVCFGDELYELPQNNSTRAYEAFALGLQLADKGELNGFVVDGDGSSLTHAQFGIDGYTALLAARRITSGSIASTVGAPILYFDGANANLRSNFFSGVSVFQVGIGRIAYNQFTGGAWQTTEVQNGWYVNYFPIYTNDLNEPFFSVMGSAEYETKDEAIAAAPAEIEGIMTRLPKIPYFVAGAVVFQTSDSFTNSVKSRVVSVNGADYFDMRVQKLNDANKKYTYSLDQAIPEEQQYYAGKHGSDSNNGKSWAQAFLTPQKVFDTIATLVGGDTPSQSKQYGAKIGAGTYTGPFDMSSIEWVIADAREAFINSDTIKINSNCTILFNEMERSTGSGVTITKTGSGEAFIYGSKTNGLAGDGLCFIDNGFINMTVDNVIADTTANFILDTNPSNTCGFKLLAKKTKGRVIVNTNSTGYVKADEGDTNFNLSNGVSVYNGISDWTGNILSSGVGTEIYLANDKRNSSLSSDAFDVQALVYKNGKTFRRHGTAINYAPSILTDHRIIAVTSTGTPRTVVISTEDILSASTDSPRYFTVIDEGGDAGANNITVTGESGGFSFVIAADGDSIDLYSNGTTLFIK